MIVDNMGTVLCLSSLLNLTTLYKRIKAKDNPFAFTFCPYEYLI